MANVALVASARWTYSDAISPVLSTLPAVLAVYFFGLLFWTYSRRASPLPTIRTGRKSRKPNKSRRTATSSQSSSSHGDGKTTAGKRVTLVEAVQYRQPAKTLQDLASNLPIFENSCKKCGLVPSKAGCRYECCRPCCESQAMSVCAPHNTGARVADMLLDEALQYPSATLDFSYQHLRKCSPRIGGIGLSLTSLNLSNNRLRSIPEEISQLVNIEELFLQYNLLEALPDSICSLTALAELDVKNNMLKKLPESIGQLNQLVILNATNNSIRSLPDSICCLKELEELCLHANHLVWLPDDFCDLSSLQSLYLAHNRLAALPERFGNFARLTEVDLSSNELTVLPESIVFCHSLERVWLSRNRLRQLPTRIGWLARLSELHLQDNQLRYLPLSMHRLRLYALTTTNNPFLSFTNSPALQRMLVEQARPFPSLQELSARSVMKRPVLPVANELPSYLLELLRGIRWCTNCGGPFFTFGSQQVVFCTVAVYYRLPLLEERCSPHGTEVCKAFLSPD